MTPAKQAKAAGLNSLAEVASITRQSVQTLSNWSKYKPELFAVVISGCVMSKKGESYQVD
jgi:hypothetical protein